MKLTKQQIQYVKAHMKIASLPKRIAKSTSLCLNADGTRNFTFKKLNLTQIIQLLDIAEQLYGKK